MKIKLFEEFNELDPYGEEDWNDENEIKKGDIVTTIRDIESLTGKIIRKGVDYKVVDIAFGGNYISLKGQSSWFLVNAFKKVNESHDDVDPYGEEIWIDENKIDEIVRRIENNELHIITCGAGFLIYDHNLNPEVFHFILLHDFKNPEDGWYITNLGGGADRETDISEEDVERLRKFVFGTLDFITSDLPF